MTMFAWLHDSLMCVIYTPVSGVNLPVDMTAPPAASATEREGERERRGGNATRESTAFCSPARYTVLRAFGTGQDGTGQPTVQHGGASRASAAHCDDAADSRTRSAVVVSSAVIVHDHYVRRTNGILAYGAR